MRSFCDWRMENGDGESRNMDYGRKRLSPGIFAENKNGITAVQIL